MSTCNPSNATDLQNQVKSQSNFSCNFFLNITGSKDITANNASMPIEVHDSMSLDDVSWCSVVPACIAINDGGITPKNVPIKNGTSGTFMTGDVMFINQLGKNGVILKNMM